MNNGDASALTVEQAITIGNHTARAVITANSYARDYSQQGDGDRSSLWGDAAQKLMDPEPWMSACCGFKLFGIGDGGRKLQPSKYDDMDFMGYVGLILDSSSAISDDEDRDILVDTCVRLAIGATATEEEWGSAIADYKEEDKTKIPPPSLPSEEEPRYDEWAKSLTEEELPLMYALQTSMIIAATYESLRDSASRYPGAIFKNIRKACAQIPDTLDAFFSIMRGRHQGDKDMQLAHETSQVILNEILEQAREDDISLDAVTLENLWNLLLTKAEEFAGNTELVNMKKSDWAKRVGLRAWSDIVFLKALASPGTSFMLDWYNKQRGYMEVPDDLIPPWMHDVIIHDEEDNSWRSVPLQPPPVIEHLVADESNGNTDTPKDCKDNETAD